MRTCRQRGHRRDASLPFGLDVQIRGLGVLQLALNFVEALKRIGVANLKKCIYSSYTNGITKAVNQYACLRCESLAQ